MMPARSILAAAAVLALAACATVDVKENSFFFPRPLMADGERIEVVASDGTRLVGRLLRAEHPRGTLIFFNGNDDLLELSGSRLHKYASFGFNVVSVNYRGYGESGGSPDVANLKSDSLQVYQTVAQRQDLGTRRLLLYGLSLGSCVAAYVAIHEPVDALVVESAETNVRQILRAWTPWYGRPFVRYRIAPALDQVDNLNALRAYRGPLLILCGRDDDIAPPAFARALYEASSSGQKQLVSVPAGHDDIPEAPEFGAAFGAFATRIFGPPATSPTDSMSVNVTRG